MLLQLERDYTSTAALYYDKIVEGNVHDTNFKVRKEAYNKRLEARNLKCEKFFGSKPQHKLLVDEVKKIEGLTAPDVWLFFDMYYMLASNYNKKATAFRDIYYRRNKELRGKKFLAKASFVRLVKVGLLIKEKQALIGVCADQYKLGTKFYELLEVANEQTFTDVVLVNPMTDKVVKPLSNKLEDAPEQLKQLAASIDMGHQICLSTAHSEARQALKNASTEEDKQRAASDLYVLKAITINGYQLQANGEVKLRQAWGKTWTGRMNPVQGGFIGMSNTLKSKCKSKFASSYDYDLSAAHLRFACEIAKELKVKVPFMNYYVDHKEQRQEFADAIGGGCTAAIVKTALLTRLFGSSAPTPKTIKAEVSRAIKKAEKVNTITNDDRREIRNTIYNKYAFVAPFGFKLYEKAYEVLKPLNSELDKLTTKMYNHYQENAETTRKGNKYVTNAIGCREWFWTKGNKPTAEKGGDTKTCKRKLMSFIFTGRESFEVLELTKANPDAKFVSYEFDGIKSDRELNNITDGEFVKWELKEAHCPQLHNSNNLTQG